MVGNVRMYTLDDYRYYLVNYYPYCPSIMHDLKSVIVVLNENHARLRLIA